MEQDTLTQRTKEFTMDTKLNEKQTLAMSSSDAVADQDLGIATPALMTAAKEAVKQEAETPGLSELKDKCKKMAMTYMVCPQPLQKTQSLLYSSCMRGHACLIIEITCWSCMLFGDLFMSDLLQVSGCLTTSWKALVKIRQERPQRIPKAKRHFGGLHERLCCKSRAGGMGRIRRRNRKAGYRHGGHEQKGKALDRKVQHPYQFQGQT